MAFGLARVWAHPYQTCLSSLDEVPRKLTLLLNSGDNWAYAFVWLNEDTQHVPLSKKGHLSTMTDGVPSRNTCGHLCQLEVCQLLQCGDQVVYPEGLNGGLKPVLTFLTASPQGMNMLGTPTHKPSFLPVDLSCITLGDHAPKDTSSQESGNSTPKRPISMALEARMEESSKLVASPQASLQAALPDDTEPIGHSSPITPMSEAPRAASIPVHPLEMTWVLSPKRYYI